MASNVDLPIKEDSSPGASSSTSSARVPSKSRYPEIELGELADSLCSHSDEDGTGVEDVEEEDDEASRLRRIQENQLLLSSLGFEPGMNAVASTSSLPQSLEPVRKKRRIKTRTATYDRSGYILSLPEPGEKQVMACVELPSDRKLRKKIADGAYVDCSRWAEGEGRRWRFGDGRNPLQEGEEVVVGDVGPDFRWRRWLGKDRELRSELAKIGQIRDADVRGTRATVTVDHDVSEYSLIPGLSCHQCRRKSDKAKMKCRNTNPECNAVFCSSCCKRYSYFEFDPDSRSFICPLCMNICNCSLCIRKRDLSHLLENNGGLRTESLTRKLKREGVSGTVETYLKEMGTIRQAPFDRVRLVCREEDIISPELPPEPAEVIVKPKTVKTKKSKKSLTAGGQDREAKGSNKKKSPVKNGKNVHKSVILKFKVPNTTNPPQAQAQAALRRPKEVDSDGDTFGGYSDDDDVENQNRANSPDSTLSSAPSTLSATPPRRLAFPPRPPPTYLESSVTTTSLAQIMDAEPGYIRPDMIQSIPHESSPQLISQDKDEVVAVTRVHKRKRPPPAASIVRAPSYMTNPKLAKSTHQNATASSSSSTSSTNLSTEISSQVSHPPASGFWWANGIKQKDDSHASPLTGDIDSSSPDPLLLSLPTFVNDDVEKLEKRIAHDVFLSHQLRCEPEAESDSVEDTPLVPPVTLPSVGEHGRDPDPLFPDTPLWYTYNQHQHQSPPTREGR